MSQKYKGGERVKYICSVCGYVHDEAVGGNWNDLPESWKCPICGAGKDAFRLQEADRAPKAAAEKPHVERELSPMELSVICSNLARGCEKQYLAAEAEKFKTLADFFRGKAELPSEASPEELLSCLRQDLNLGFPYGQETAKKAGDRGAQRCQVWSEKVTRMLESLLTRYQSEGEKMLENTGVWVCSVCGFVYVGDAPPALCPVCKVPAWKFDKMEGRA